MSVEELEEEDEDKSDISPTTLNSAPRTTLIAGDGLGQLDPTQLKRTEGYIYKKGGAVNTRGGRRNWKKRWFVLTPIDYKERTAFEFRYYDGPKGKLKGTLGLFDVEIFCEARSLHKKVKYEFQINLQNGGILQLSCDDPDEREEWIESLNMTVAYLRKISSSSSVVISGYDPSFEDDEDCYQLGEEIAKNCQAFGPGLFGAEAGSRTHFLIQMHDIMGQEVVVGGMPITITILNEDTLYYVKVTDNRDGTYSAFYTLSQPGAFNLHIKLNDEHEIFGSPFQIEILPTRTSSQACTAEGPGITSVFSNTSTSFTVIARDIFGNRKLKGGDPFEVGIMGPARLQSLTDNNDGSYTCSFATQSPKEIDVYTASSLLVMITLYGRHITGSPYRPDIIDDEVQLPIQPSTKALRSLSIQSNDRDPRLSFADPGIPAAHITTSTSNSVALAAEKARRRASSEYNSSFTGNDTNTNKSPFSLKHLSTEQPPSQPQHTQELMHESNINESTAPTAATSSPISRLERARRRAMMAKAMTDKQSSLPSNPQPALHAQAHAVDETAGSSSRRQRRVSLMQSNLASEDQRATRRASIQRTDMDPITGLPFATRPQSQSQAQVQSQTHAQTQAQTTASHIDQQNQQQQASRMSKSELIHTRPSLSLGSSSSSSRSDIETWRSELSRGLVGNYPLTALPEEIQMWETTRAALQSTEVLSRLTAGLAVLKEVFELQAETVEGLRLMRLVSTGSSTAGLYYLLETYDVVPAYLSSREVKMAYALITSAQRYLKTPSSMAGGGVGIDFIHFVKYLVMVSIFALSKATTLNSLYGTNEAKIDVMLMKWGLADKLKLQLVKTRMRLK